MSQSQSHSQVVPASPEAVAAAITSPHGLGTWLCSEARVEKRPGGRLLLDWAGGARVSGHWITFEPPTALAWRGQPNSSAAPEVAFALAPDAGGTRVTVTASDMPAEGPLASADFWPRALDALAEFVATGRDLRLMQRPMLGVAPEFNFSESGADVASPTGVLMGTLTPEGAAAKAGMKRGDRLQKIGDKEITDWSQIGPSLDGHRAGEVMNVVVWRDGATLTLPVTLGQRPQPELPATAGAVMAAMEGGTARSVADIRAAVDGLTDAQAAQAPSEGAWSVKQVLAHLIASERFGHLWLTYLDGDDTPADWPSSFALVESHLNALPLDELCRLLASDLAFSTGLTRAALAKNPPPPLFRQLAESVHSTFTHMDEHVAQIRAAADAMRAA